MGKLFKKFRKNRKILKNGLRFYEDFDHKLGYDDEDQANEFIKIIRKNSMLPYVRLVTLYQQVKFCEKHNIPGSFVECGVWKGGAVGLMGLANQHAKANPRHLHLFDAFDAICEPDNEVDGAVALEQVRLLAGKDAGVSGELKSLTGVYDSMGGDGTIEENVNLFDNIVKYDKDYVHYHKGWFQDTLPKDAPSCGDIAILRLDGDWYASIKVCLESLYSQVVKGGFIIIDDYGFYEGCTKAVDEFREENNIADFLHHIDSGSRYWIKS
jgi:hypothetical protein